MEKPFSCRHYFVDEAGDTTIFSHRGKVLIGEQGCSRYFILGVLDIPNPEPLHQGLEALHKSLLADLYFKKGPSVQPDARKTALMFHAKDDVPEVRREVFALLQKHEFRFLAVVRDKQRVLEYMRRRNTLDLLYRYTPNDLDDTRQDAYGVYYTQKKPLTLAAMENDLPGI